MASNTLKSITLKLMTADEIRAVSKGEVTKDATFNEAGEPETGGLFCREIFGKHGLDFGHIELAYPVVHPWYEDAVRLLLDQDDLSDGEAVLAALREMDFDARCKALREQDSGENQLAIKCILALKESGTDPEVLIIRSIAVVPPVMRPMVRMSGGGTLSSDLNDLYVRVIARNNKLKELSGEAQDIRPGAYLKDARERLASSVKALIGKAGYEGPLHSLTDVITSSQGFLKRNLEGKRVDYSGRSVIIAGPDLDMLQCGFPREMALDIFKLFIARKMVENGSAAGAQEALEKIALEPHSKEVRQATDQVASERQVLLHRAPTLNRLGIQPFQPVLVEDRAISVHPLVCYGFNADFDGDQMAVHVPISGKALDETRRLLDSAVNLVSPGNGKPVAAPVQDIVIGLWYLTADAVEEESVEYSSVDKLFSDVESDKLGIHSPVMLKDSSYSADSILTTAGRVIFNSKLPEELRYINYQTGRQQLVDIVEICLEKCGRQRTREMLDTLNRLGMEYATRYAPSYGLGIFPSSEEVDRIAADCLKKERKLREELQTGQIDSDTFYNRLIGMWMEAKSEATDALKTELKSVDRGLNPVYALVESGARGNNGSIGQSFGIGGPAWKEPDADGRDAFEGVPESNFRKGFSPTEHFARSFSARKGLIDTSVRVEFGINMMRQLIYLGQGVLITSADCGTQNGMDISRIEFNGRIVEPLSRRIKGRTSLEDIKDISGKVIVNAGDLISKAQAQRIEESAIEKVRVRTMLTCGEDSGVCAKCYGEDLAYGEPVQVGTAVGVIAAQAVSDPIIQLTMKTYYLPYSAVAPGKSDHPGGLAAVLDMFAGNQTDLTPEDFIEKLQRILGFQGVEVNDKHFEILVRNMYTFVKVTDPGDTSLVKGEVIHLEVFNSENAKAISQAVQPAQGVPAILGAHDAAAKSPSVISSAAIGDAVGTIAVAAAKKSRDDLTGTLERIVLGLAPNIHLAANQ